MPQPNPNSSSHGAHGGPVLKHAGGNVEISVFESGVPPGFRLYFLDDALESSAPPPSNSVVAETERLGGICQRFLFQEGEGFLESTSNIPEPHEFLMRLMLESGRQRLACLFSEESHGHEHGEQPHAGSGSHCGPLLAHAHNAHGHAHHGHSHDHDHHRGGGVLGWFRATFAHSHDIAEQVDTVMESSVKGIRALKISLIGLGITALLPSCSSSRTPPARSSARCGRMCAPWVKWWFGLPCEPALTTGTRLGIGFSTVKPALEHLLPGISSNFRKPSANQRSNQPYG